MTILNTLAMGDYTSYVWSSIGIVSFFLLFQGIWVVRRFKAVQQQLIHFHQE